MNGTVVSGEHQQASAARIVDLRREMKAFLDWWFEELDSLYRCSKDAPFTDMRKLVECAGKQLKVLGLTTSERPEDWHTHGLENLDPEITASTFNELVIILAVRGAKASHGDHSERHHSRSTYQASKEDLRAGLDRLTKITAHTDWLQKFLTKQSVLIEAALQRALMGAVTKQVKQLGGDVDLREALRAACEALMSSDALQIAGGRGSEGKRQDPYVALSHILQGLARRADAIHALDKAAQCLKVMFCDEFDCRPAEIELWETEFSDLLAEKACGEELQILRIQLLEDAVDETLRCRKVFFRGDAGWDSKEGSNEPFRIYSAAEFWSSLKRLMMPWRERLRSRAGAGSWSEVLLHFDVPISMIHQVQQFTEFEKPRSREPLHGVFKAVVVTNWDEEDDFPRYLDGKVIEQPTAASTTVVVDEATPIEDVRRSLKKRKARVVVSGHKFSDRSCGHDCPVWLTFLDVPLAVHLHTRSWEELDDEIFGAGRTSFALEEFFDELTRSRRPDFPMTILFEADEHHPGEEMYQTSSPYQSAPYWD